MKLWHKFVVPTLSVVILAFFILTFYLASNEREQHIGEAKRQLTRIGESLGRNWNNTMLLSGSDNLARDQLFAQMDDPEIINVTLRRNMKLSRINPASSPYATKAIELDVIRSGEIRHEMGKTGEIPTLSAYIPLIAEKACVDCHTVINKHEIKEGDVMGVIALTLSLEAPLAQIAQDQRKMIFAGIFFAFLIGITLLIVGQRVVRPIDRLMRATEKVANGDLDSKVDITSGGEIGSLANSFNQMVKHLKESGEKVKLYTNYLEKKSEELRDSEERFKSIVNTAKEGIITTSASGKIVLWNDAAENTFGYTSDEVLGKCVTVIIPEHLRQTHVEGIKTFSEEGKRKIIGKTIEVPGLRKDGTEFPIELSLVSWSTSKGVFFTSIIRDISDRKKIERMKDEFISTVRHELRTPLTSINGTLDLINKGMAGELPAKIKKLIDIARKNSVRLGKLINDLLYLQEIETNEVDFDMKPLEVTPLVKLSLENVKSIGQQFNVEFVMEDLLPDVKVNADGDRLAQVLDNILSNAAKFSPSNGTVEVSVSNNNDAVRVSVKDHGPGIPEEYRNQLFKKFTQADSSMTRERGGTGLGMSIAKSIIERHGGKIGFETEIDVGTTFYFELPVWKG